MLPDGVVSLRRNRLRFFVPPGDRQIAEEPAVALGRPRFIERTLELEPVERHTRADILHEQLALVQHESQKFSTVE